MVRSVFDPARTAINMRVIIRELLETACNIYYVSGWNVFQLPIQVRIPEPSIKVARQIKFTSFTQKRVAFAVCDPAEIVKLLVKEGDKSLTVRGQNIGCY